MTTAGMTELHKTRRERVVQALTIASRGLSTPDVARQCGLALSQARRQLLRLEDDGLVCSTIMYLPDQPNAVRVWSLRPTRREAPDG